MNKYFYYYDEKITLWKRNFFAIEEENEELANQKAKEIIAEKDVDDIDLHVDRIEYLYSREEPYSEENNDSPTLELFSKEDGNLLYSNNW